MKKILLYTNCVIIILFTVVFAITFFSKENVHNFENSDIDNISVTAPIIHERQKDAFNMIISDMITQKADFSVEYFETDDYHQRIMVDLSSGKYSDIIIIPAMSLSDNLISNKHIVPVEDIINKSIMQELNVDRSFFKKLYYNDKLRGIPYDVFASGVFYNENIFEKYNLTFPKNYEELKHTISVLKRNDITPFAINLDSAGTYLFDYILSDIVADTDINQGDFTRILSVTDELIKLGAFPENFFEMNDYDTRSMFIEGKAAMLVEDTSFCSSVSELYNASKSEKINIGVEYFPSFASSYNNEKRMMYDMGNYIILFTDNIQSSPDKKKAAVDFINHIFNDAVADVFFSETYTITTVKLIRPHSYSLPQMLKFFKLIDESQLYISPLKNTIENNSKNELMNVLKQKYNYDENAKENREAF